MDEEGNRISANSEIQGVEKEEQEIGENEEFYETIEAPKFVDFTVPECHRPDDRYWFCSRVGCDQKHEEEMDSEAIYKNFVLRVMAARSPNVRFQKALKRDCSSKNLKCPHSVPPKSSKSRLSRLAVISSISLKLDDIKVRVKPKPVSKLCSTPKSRGQQVAAKYLTTPRNKKCIEKTDAFRSVQNMKPRVVVPKDRAVAKTLTFPTPKKAFNLKASVELRTPLTKLCEKMKKLEISSQRKTNPALPNQQPKQCGDRPKKSLPINSSARQKVPSNDKCRSGVLSPKSTTKKNKQDAKSTKGKGLGRLHGQCKVKQVHFATEIKAESRDELLGDLCSRDLVADEAAISALEGKVNGSNSFQENTIVDNIQTSETSIKENTIVDNIQTSETSIKENTIVDNIQTSETSIKENTIVDNILTSETSIKENTDSQGRSQKSEITDNDDKENATASDGNRYKGNLSLHTLLIDFLLSKLQAQKWYPERNILGIQNSDRKKFNEAVVKDNGASGVKPMKLKPTNPKPFKFRTDERGILREANLEKKNIAIGLQKEHHENQKGIAFLKPIKKETKTKTSTCDKVHQSKQEENKPKALTCESNTKRKLEHVSKKKTTSNVLRLQRNLDVSSQAKTGTVNTSSGNSKLVGK